VSVTPSIPRFVDLPALAADPLSFLRAAHHSRGSLAVISEDQAIFSGARPCSGVVAVFGEAALRQIMNDPDVFGMPISKAKTFSLPASLQRLNAGLFTMTGAQHRSRQQLLLRLLGRQSPADNCDAIVDGWIAFRDELTSERDVSLLSEMRRLILNISGGMIFGDAGLELGSLIQTYFDDRRKFSGTDGSVPAERRNLVRTGMRLDEMLRAKLAKLRAAGSNSERECMFGRLSRLEITSGEFLTDDELISHGNVLFMSSSEPVAVTLTWILLLLSQRPDLRLAIRKEVRAVFTNGKVPRYFSEAQVPFLNGVVMETLRLLPPNAIMVRLTTKKGQLLTHELPPSCEVVISPYVAHRDSRTYIDPDNFDPWRWRDFNPSSYSYFPFGAGTRYCLGKQLATFTVVSVLARMLSEYDVYLSRDQSIDWKMDITLMPTSDPVVRFVPLTAANEACVHGRLSGPVEALVSGGADISSPPNRTY
jgi:cytochrome P450